VTTLDRDVGLVAALDRCLTRLATQGRTPPHAPCDGDEAALVGASHALELEDWVFWGRQVNVPALVRGVTPTELLMGGLTAGVSLNPALAGRRIVTCTQGPAARLPHAAGLAFAARGRGHIAFTDLGAGAISDGDVHVGVNFAAVLRAPVVFFIRSRGLTPIVERAEGWGIEGVVVDGHDVLAVRDAVRAAREAALARSAPVWIEARLTEGAGAPPALLTAHETEVESALAAAERRVAELQSSSAAPHEHTHGAEA
jgi:pyruvate dehydrogenase E1 component alpha subunit